MIFSSTNTKEINRLFATIWANRVLRSKEAHTLPKPTNIKFVVMMLREGRKSYFVVISIHHAMALG